MGDVSRRAPPTTATGNSSTSPPGPDRTVAEWFGGIDVYLFDQLQRGRFSPGMAVLDAGCGTGRNLVYFLRSGYRILGVDRDVEAIRQVHSLARQVAPTYPVGCFQVAELTWLPFRSRRFDAVISNAVLHFAVDESHFAAMLNEIWRVLAPGGMLFARLASSIGIEGRVRPVAGRRFVIPDGTERFLVDEPYLLRATEKLGAELLDPIKTVNVQGQRCMTTWCLRKSH